MLHILLVVLVAWWLIHLACDLFGGTPGAYKHKDLGNRPSGLVMKDYREGTIDQYLSYAEKALIWKWIAFGMIALAMWGVGALAYTMLWMK